MDLFGAAEKRGKAALGSLDRGYGLPALLYNMENLDAPLKKAKARCPWVPKIPKKKEKKKKREFFGRNLHFLRVNSDSRIEKLIHRYAFLPSYDESSQNSLHPE
jgi:hypothetical protein